MLEAIILAVLLLLIIECLATRSSNRLSFWLGIISLLLWIGGVLFKVGGGKL